MSNFKKVLEIEKKFEHSINTSNSNFEKKIDSFILNLKLKEDAIKQDFQKSLEKDFQKLILGFKKEAKLIITKSEEEAKYIKENAKSKKAVDFIVEGVKNV